MFSDPNLFLALNRWASSQPENFLTEAFVVLLNRLSENSPQAFAHVIGRITGGAIQLDPDSSADVTVQSQALTDLGSPDIEITGPDLHCFIEVKDGSPVDLDQLNRYSRVLSERAESAKCLVLLTRYPPPLVSEPYLVEPVRWSHIAEWLGELRNTSELDETTRYLNDQFIGFLEGKGMTAERVGWELAAGLTQLLNLKTMMQEALISAGAHRVWMSYGSEFSGVAVPDPDSNSSAYFLNIWFSDPGHLLFITRSDKVLEDRRTDWEDHPNNQLKRKLRIDSEEMHFFSRPLDSQRRLLEEFCASCLADTVYDPVTPGSGEVSEVE